MNDAVFHEQLKAERATQHEKGKAEYEKSLIDREGELNDELDRLSGNQFGLLLHLSCGCVVRVEERYWSHNRQELVYHAVYRSECDRHV